MVDVTTVVPPTSPRRVQKNNHDTWLVRNDAMDLLGCSYKTLLAYEKKGKLTPQRVWRKNNGGNEQMLIVYNPLELAKLPKRHADNVRSPGEMAARAFEMFNEGRNVRDIVVELRETPDNIMQLKDRWLDAGGSEAVITAEAKTELVRLVGPFSSVADLVMLLDKRIGKAKA